jgi:hypothetical protein
MQTGIAEALSPQRHGRSRRGDMAGCIEAKITFSLLLWLEPPVVPIHPHLSSTSPPK